MSEAQAYAASTTAASRSRRNHVRLDSSSVADLPGFGERPLVGAGPRRLAARAADSRRRRRTCSTFAPRPAARRCSSPPPAIGSPRSIRRKVVSDDCARISSARTSTAELVDADALEWKPERQFDAILLDAPCSATGTFRRHPEVLYRARPKIIADNAELQARLLDRAADWLKPGGTPGLFGLLARAAGGRSR